MTDDVEVDECPKCGDYSNIDTLTPINHIETVEHVDSGTDDFLQKWVRFHCGTCDTQIAVLESEEWIDE